MVLRSIALFAAENGTNRTIASPLDALWWGITTMTTVGYGDVYPVTAEGRIAATVLMVLGIGLYSAITATVTSYMLSDNRSADLATQFERLSAPHAAWLQRHSCWSGQAFPRRRLRTMPTTIESSGLSSTCHL